MRFQWMSGRLAQMVERPPRMREVGGSIPPVSTLYSKTTTALTRLQNDYGIDTLARLIIDLSFLILQECFVSVSNHTQAALSDSIYRRNLPACDTLYAFPACEPTDSTLSNHTQTVRIRFCECVFVTVTCVYVAAHDGVDSCCWFV